MGPKDWLRVADAVGNLVLSARQLGRRDAPDAPARERSSSSFGGALEARLAGVVVSALKEAFERDRARMDFEREHVEAERRRAEMALRLERSRQVGERELAGIRATGAAAVAAWIATALAAALIAGYAAFPPRLLLALAWLLLIAALAASLAAHHRVTRALAGLDDSGLETSTGALPDIRSSAAAGWLLLLGLAAAAASLLTALASSGG